MLHAVGFSVNGHKEFDLAAHTCSIYWPRDEDGKYISPLQLKDCTGMKVYNTIIPPQYSNVLRNMAEAIVTMAYLSAANPGHKISWQGMKRALYKKAGSRESNEVW